jgi:hypothetical protein
MAIVNILLNRLRKLQSPMRLVFSFCYENEAYKLKEGRNLYLEKFRLDFLAKSPSQMQIVAYELVNNFLSILIIM